MSNQVTTVCCGYCCTQSNRLQSIRGPQNGQQTGWFLSCGTASCRLWRQWRSWGISLAFTNLLQNRKLCDLHIVIHHLAMLWTPQQVIWDFLTFTKHKARRLCQSLCKEPFSASEDATGSVQVCSLPLFSFSFLHPFFHPGLHVLKPSRFSIYSHSLAWYVDNTRWVRIHDRAVSNLTKKDILYGNQNIDPHRGRPFLKAANFMEWIPCNTSHEWTTLTRVDRCRSSYDRKQSKLD